MNKFLLCSHENKDYFSFRLKKFLCENCLILNQKVVEIRSPSNMLKLVSQKYNIVIIWNELLFFKGFIYFYENVNNEITYAIEIIENKNELLIEHLKKDLSLNLLQFPGDDFEKDLLTDIMYLKPSIKILDYFKIDEFLNEFTTDPNSIIFEIENYNIINFNEYMLSMMKKAYLKEIKVEFPNTHNFPNCFSNKINTPTVELFIPTNKLRELSGMNIFNENKFSITILKGTNFIGYIECELTSLLSSENVLKEYFSDETEVNYNFRLFLRHEKTKKEKPTYNSLFIRKLIIDDKYLKEEGDLKIVELLLYHILLFIKNASIELDTTLVFTEFSIHGYDKKIINILNNSFRFSPSESGFPYDVLFLKNTDFLAKMRFYANKISNCLLNRPNIKGNLFFDKNELNQIFQ